MAGLDGRLAEQSDASLRPALHRAAYHQRPFVRGVDVVNEAVNVLVPAAEVIGEFAFGAFDGPGFHLPVVAFDKANEIHEFAAADRVVRHMAARSEPVRPDHPCEMRRQPVHRH
jgi:hypothetical protein